MKLIDAERELKSLDQPVLQTTDVAAKLRLSRAYASKVMSRLAESGFAIQLNRGKWVIADRIERLLMPEYFTAPSPSYISLQTALFHHGMISQIPEVIYAVTTAKTRRHETPVGVYSLHHMEPEFFFGFDVIGSYGIKMAIPEKALLDVCYLSPARSGIFRSLPELELPKSFSIKKAREVIHSIQSKSRRTVVSQKFDEFLRSVKSLDSGKTSRKKGERK